MKYLTEDSIAKNILQMAAPIAASTNCQLTELWCMSIASVTRLAILSLWLVRGEFRRRLPATSAA